ncbi:hypothetical protein [Methylovirgula sp. HY1]|uniref:hypothetical protein n=1 Tax=Methylovirgula sp. HY1 TaxID=2822761 RepID=UPI001C5AAE3A|nr:hypothetical protein [Methylovirgula sp. HY1]QXX74823.1 hypothetical protein MHY1_01640 [Methylovirgula sp. HY1]
MKKCRNYREPNAAPEPYHILLEKADELETHPGVIAAINAVATERRPAMVIWKAPTGPEADHIVMALEEYIHFKDFPATKNDIYAWGQDEVRL